MERIVIKIRKKILKRFHLLYRILEENTSPEFLPEKRRISKKMQLLVTIEHGLQPANLEFTVVFRCVVISYFCEHTTGGLSKLGGNRTSSFTVKFPRVCPHYHLQ